MLKLGAAGLLIICVGVAVGHSDADLLATSVRIIIVYKCPNGSYIGGCSIVILPITPVNFPTIEINGNFYKEMSTTYIQFHNYI